MQITKKLTAQRKWRLAHPDYYKEYYRKNKKYFQEYWKNHRTVVDLKKQKLLYKKWREKNPDYFNEYRNKNEERLKAARARVKINNLIRYGKLSKPPCEVCGNEKPEAHHDNYNKPYEVRWLCKTHHEEHHAKVKQT